MKPFLKLNLFYLFSLLLLLSCKQPDATVIGTPAIKAGTAKITGRIISPHGTNNDKIYVTVFVPHQISGEHVQYKTLADRSGKFSIDVDVETDVSLIGLNTSLKPNKSLYVKLTSGGITNIDVAYNSDFDFKSIDVTPAGMTQNDMTRSLEVIGEMIDHSSGRKPEPLYNKSTDYFLNYAKTILSERLEILKNKTQISKESKRILSKDFRLFLYSTFVIDYEKYMIFNYKATNGDKSKNPDIQKIDRFYFRFLKDFDLNDPQYLICSEFLKFQKEVLQNEILGIPDIGESDIPSWLAKVKTILSDLVGFKDGQYYDILAANAYGRQLTDEVRPLSEKQKENIANYWKKGEIAKILLRKNQQVVEIDKFKSPAVINDLSSVSADKVMETIVAKHKNKVVLIDLWATWCRPCMDAMQQFRSTKSEFHDKDVAFVYITNGSSPQKLWEEKIKGIGNEHYYLTDDQWGYLMKQFEFKYIPSYLVYNKQGMLINKFTGFPGNDKLKEVINTPIQ